MRIPDTLVENLLQKRKLISKDQLVTLNDQKDKDK